MTGKRLHCAYKSDYRVDETDPCYPRIVETEPNTGCTFLEALRQLQEMIRSRRDHWVDQLRESMKLTQDNLGE